MSDRSATTDPDDWLAYWERTLAGASPRQSLPKDRQRAGPRAASLSHVDGSVDEDLTRRLGDVARRLDCSLAELLLASFNVLLFRYTGQEDLFVGWHAGHMPVSKAGVEGRTPVVVPRTSLVPVRVSASGEQRFDGFVAAVRAVCRTGWGLLEAPPPGAVRQDTDHGPFADVVPVRFWATPVLCAGPHRPAEHHAAPVLDDDVCGGELSLIASTSDAGVRFRFVYDAERYRASFIDAMSGHFRRLLESAAANPAVALSDVSLTTPEEEAQLHRWSVGSRVPLVPNLPHVRFQTQAEQAPDKPALVFDGRELTYGELNRRANQLGHLLGGLGVSGDVPVAICLARSPDLALAFLGVLKAGGTVFPLASGAPPAQLRALLDTVAPAVIITDSAQRAVLGENGWSFICVDAIDAHLAAQPSSPPPVSVSPDHVAYLLATSGSTGRPKIVKWSFGFRDPSISFSADERHLLQSGSGTTFTVVEILRPLTSGGTLFVTPPGLELDPPRLVAFIGQHRISRVLMTPTQLRAVLEVDDLNPCQGLHHVQCSGELLSADLRRRCTERLNAQLSIAYGCTEAPSAVVRTCSPDDEPDSADVGRPSPEKQAFVLDANGGLSPIGVPGAVFLGGMMSSGYLHDPVGTTERFVAHPFDNSPDARLFRTGDLGRWLPGGRLEILGRSDRQVKVRGFRVELGEIETHLAQHDAVAHSVVVAREDRPGDQRLHAYWVPRAKDAATASSLRDYLRQRLPEHMVPSSFPELKTLPLTANGKLDYQALLALAPPEAEAEAPYVAPRNAVEETLAAIWREVLGLKRVGRHDDFFASGGQSLLATRVFAEIEKRLGCSLPLALLMEGSTIEFLAGKIGERSWPVAGPVVTALHAHGTKPPLILMPSMGGGALVWKDVMERWDPDQPVFAIGLAGRGVPWPADVTFPEIVRHYSSCIDTVAPDGMIHLAGSSFGGMVAYEMACQLRQAGRRIGAVVVIDATPGLLPAARWRFLADLPRMLGNLPRWILDDVLRSDPSKWVSELRRKSQSWRMRIELALGVPASVHPASAAFDMQKLSDDYRKRVEVSYLAARSYRAGSYDGRVVILRARTRPLAHGFSPDLGWGQVDTGGIEIVDVAGNHESMMRAPNGHTLARRVQAALDRFADQRSFDTESST